MTVTDGIPLPSDSLKRNNSWNPGQHLGAKWLAMTTTVSSSPKKEHENPRLGSVGLRFRSIMVATDCPPTSEIAVKLAARLAKEAHARLYVLHSILPELYGVDMRGPVPELALMDLQNARENLHKYLEHIPDLRMVKHKELAFLGSASEAIQSAGKSNGIDLLVLGSHGRHGLAKLTLGSVAEWAIRRLTYPVLVAGPMCDKSLRPIRSIVLATDLSQQALRPAQYASLRLRYRGAMRTFCIQTTSLRTPRKILFLRLSPGRVYLHETQQPQPDQETVPQLRGQPRRPCWPQNSRWARVGAKGHAELLSFRKQLAK